MKYLQTPNFRVRLWVLRNPLFSLRTHKLIILEFNMFFSIFARSVFPVVLQRHWSKDTCNPLLFPLPAGKGIFLELQIFYFKKKNWETFFFFYSRVIYYGHPEKYTPPPTPLKMFLILHCFFADFFSAVIKAYIKQRNKISIFYLFFNPISFFFSLFPFSSFLPFPPFFSLVKARI